MSPSAQRFWRYETQGAAQPIMSFGPESGPQLLIIPPLFEELNRTRKLLSDLMRSLADNGVASHLPDLPGTGESESELAEIDWAKWRHAVEDSAKQCQATAVLSVRGGCLLDGAATPLPVMRFSPVEGKRLIRDLVRSRSLTDESFDGDEQKAVFTAGPTMLGGYLITSDLACAVRDAEISSVEAAKTLRLETEHGEADAQIAGPPLWRRAEPTGSDELTQALTTEITGWLS